MMNYAPLVVTVLLVASALGYSGEADSTSFPSISNNGKQGDYCKKCYSLTSPGDQTVCRSPSDPKIEQGRHVIGGHVGYFQCSKCNQIARSLTHNEKQNEGLCSRGGNHRWQRAPGLTRYDMSVERKKLGDPNLEWIKVSAEDGLQENAVSQYKLEIEKEVKELERGYELLKEGISKLPTADQKHCLDLLSGYQKEAYERISGLNKVLDNLIKSQGAVLKAKSEEIQVKLREFKAFNKTSCKIIEDKIQRLTSENTSKPSDSE
jgi:hypothetical protein